MSKKGSAGGKAEATGANYETLAAAWYCTRLLLGGVAYLPIELPASTRLLSVRCQSGEPVDDVNAELSDGGRIFAQAKRTVVLSEKSSSPLAIALDQFVRQQKSWADHAATDKTRRPLGEGDRLVLLTRSGRSRNIIEVLPRLLRGVRDFSAVNLLSEVQTSQEELEVAEVIEVHIRRIWEVVYGKAPTAAEVGSLLRLMWVQPLDVEDGERDRVDALTLLRGNVLQDPSQADSAFSELVKVCARLRAERSGVDTSTLPTLLIRAGIQLQALPNFRRDIEALRTWTKARLQKSPRFTRILEGTAQSVVERAVWPKLSVAALNQSLVIVGEPGAGKSGLMYRLAASLLENHSDVIFLPVDLLNVESLAALQTELGLSRPLPEVLANWPAGGKGVLIIDALDAARKLQTQTVLRETIDQVLRIAANWNVVASIRKYDLRQGSEWRRMFAGAPVAQEFMDPEFLRVSHVQVARLNDVELAQTAAFLPQLHQLVVNSDPRLRDLLRNIFNLHLLAELLSAGVVSADLASIRTQSELLETYWRHRVHRADGRHDARETVLRVVVRKMIAAKSLRAFRDEVVADSDAGALVELERNDILRAEDEERGVDENVILFSHHVLFDYAVARLIFLGGKHPERVTQALKADRALALMVGPSLTLALDDSWNVGVSRTAFWKLAFALSKEPALSDTARLAAPMVAAEQAATLDDLKPLLAELRAASSDTDAAHKSLQNLIGAVLVRKNAGIPLAGPDAGPWPDFMRALSEIGSDAAMFALKPLLHFSTLDVAQLTAPQLASIGQAARRVLEFGLDRAQRPSSLVITAITAVARTFTSDVTASANLLRRLIERAHLEAHGHEELRWLADNNLILAESAIDLVYDIYEAAYGYLDTHSDAKTNIGNSGILPLTSNRRQDYQGAWYQLSELATKLLKKDSLVGTRAISRAMRAFVDREHRVMEGETRMTQLFDYFGIEVKLAPDSSEYWYRTAFKPVQDAPVLLAKFDEMLTRTAAEPDAAKKILGIARVVGEEAGLAVLWGSLLKAGADHPLEIASALVPIASAHLVMLETGTRYQVGVFLTQAYPHLCAAEREQIERSIIALTDERAKRTLLGCIPEGLAVTSEVQELAKKVSADPRAPKNTPELQMTASMRDFDTEAYLESKGVDTNEPGAARVRDAIRAVEEKPTPPQGTEISLETAREYLEPINNLRLALAETSEDPIPAPLRELATGTLARTAQRIALASSEVIKDVKVRETLMAALLLAANPPQEEPTRDDHYARHSAAQGLTFILCVDHPPEADALDAVRQLARDPASSVRGAVADNLYLLNRADLNWMWAELEHVIEDESDYNVVNGALNSLGRIAGLDLPRTIAACKVVISRFSSQSGEEVAETCRRAASLIADIHIESENTEARDFVVAQLANFVANRKLCGVWVTRFSGNLLVGNPKDSTDRKHQTREKTMRLYGSVLDAALVEVDRLSRTLGIQKFQTWSSSDQETLQELFQVLDEIVMRLYFASGADSYGTGVGSAERRRFYDEVRPLLEKLSDVSVVHVAHYLVQTLQGLISLDPAGVFALIARSIRASEKGGYTMESMAADLVVRIVEGYLADHREIFADQNRLTDLMDTLDAFVRAGWPSAHALTFRLGEIWR